MKNFPRLLSASLLTVVAFASVAMMKDRFAGKWKITAAPEAKGQQFSDVLIFKGGKMTAEELEKKGWPAAEYDEDVRQGGAAKFVCTLKHATEGTMKWVGNIAGSEVHGTIVWSKAGEDTRYNFNGSKAN